MALILASDVFKEVAHKLESEQNKNIKIFLGATKSSGKTLAAYVAVRDKECYICNSKIMFYDAAEKRFIAENGECITFDHVLPKSLKGCDATVNGLAACYRCNQGRGNDTTFEINTGTVSVDVRRVIKTSDIKKVIYAELARRKSSVFLSGFFHEATQEKFPTGYVSATLIQHVIDWVEHEIGLVLNDEMLRKIPRVAVGVLKYV